MKDIGDAALSAKLVTQGMPWIINAVGAGFIGFAIGGTGDMALTYVQDSYQQVRFDYTRV
jgi:hypothetical protein